MKRPRSYDEDVDSSSNSNKERSDRHHRGFYDRSIDDDRDSSRPHRRRFDHSPSFDRYRDVGGGGGDERIHRSNSFSTLRRDYPKGHRSERSVRDRSWLRLRNPRSSSEKEPIASASASDLGKKKPADLDTSCFHTDRLRKMESLSGEISERIETKEKGEEKVNRESCSSSEMEMEEGELQPEPEPEKCEERGEFEKKEESNEGGREETEKKVEASDDDRDVIEKNIKASNGCIHGGKEEDSAGENGGEKEWRAENICPREGDGNLVDGQEEIRKPEDEIEIEAFQEEKQEEGHRAEEDVDVSGMKEGIDVDVDVETDAVGQKKEEEGRGIDLEAEPEGAIADGDYQEEGVLELVANKVQEIHKDKGKSIAMFNSNREDCSVDDRDAGEGPSSSRGFEFVFPSDSIAHCGGFTISKHKGDKPKLETLDLSLSLPGISSDQTSKKHDAKPSSPSRARSLQSLPSSFRTNSDGFTNSISMSGSQTFVHNPSCSLMQNSLDNFEQSVGSRPLFQGVDQVSNSTTVWQAQASNDPKPLFQRMVMNGNHPHNSIQALNGHLNRQSSIRRQLSPTQSHGSSDTRSERSKNKRLLTRERSSSSLFRSEHKDGKQLVLNGDGCERIISKIASEPLQVVCRIFQQTTDHSIAYLKETIHEMLVKAEKNGTLCTLQEILERRSDLTTETMLKCPRNMLEIFVALKTGLPDFLRRSTTNVPSSDLVEIFLNLKCRNLACRSMLPVDDCECKVCVQKSSFCSACMCLVCSKFDNASNTCGWVGCDVCLHWCHTDCGLRDSHIRNGQTSSGAQGISEMQFHCIGCDHPSEMFGFVKDVFKTCGKSWNAETLAKELSYVRRIFSASNDVKGKRLSAVAERMLGKLADNVNLSEAIDCIMGYFSESEANTSSSPSLFPPKESSRNVAEGSNVPSSSYCLEKVKVPQIENTNVLFTRDFDRVGKLTRDTEIPMNPEKKPVVDELETVVRYKQAEAKMYQERADNARREAEGLKHIAAAKNAKIDEEYSTRIAKLRLLEAEEHRRQKLEELQVIERAYREYFNMKMRMQSDISALLMKMEAMKRNFNS